MIFVDTSVWITFFTGRDVGVVRKLADLLDDDRVALSAPVRVELLSHVGRRQQALLSELLSAVPTFRSTDRTWDTLEEWATVAVRRGARFGAGDLLVAAIAAEHRGTLWSLDSDFERMSTLGFVDLHP